MEGPAKHRVIHLSPLTALPMETVASLALSSRVGLVLTAKDRVMWDTNSTDMPTAYRQRGNFSWQGSRQGRKGNRKASQAGVWSLHRTKQLAYGFRSPTAKGHLWPALRVTVTRLMRDTAL